MRLDVGARARFTRFGSFEILLDLTFEMHTFTSRERSFQRLAQFKTAVIPARWIGRWSGERVHEEAAVLRRVVTH